MRAAVDLVSGVVDESGQFRFDLRTSSSIVSACVQVIAEPRQYDGAHSFAPSNYVRVTLRPPPPAADSVEFTLKLPYVS